MTRFRELFVLGVLAVLVPVLSACSSEDDQAADEEAPGAPPGVYFGAVAFSGDRIAFDLGPGDEDGLQKVRAFVTDGTPDGDAEWFEGTATSGKMELTAVSGNARLTGDVADMQVDGTITLRDGVQRHFHTIPATHGAGIYQLTVTPEGRFTGTSESGAQLQAQQNGIFVEGTISTPTGERISFRDADLHRAYNFPAPGVQPGTYTVVVSRYGLTQTGRSGAIDQGVPEANVINLDLGASAETTPGVWYGKVAGGTDQFVMVLSEPNPQGMRRLRVYLSDGEPEPEGDIEWFVGEFAGDVFNLASASKNATMTGQFGPEAAAGEIVLEGAPPRRFFAVPAGDGAGIYEVRVTPEKQYDGTSEQGGTLSLTQRGDSVSGTITTPGGKEVPVAAYDLTQVFNYSVEGSLPDTYLAFASPSGRYIIGRSGDVRGGTAGNNIIGLDKAC